MVECTCAVQHSIGWRRLVSRVVLLAVAGEIAVALVDALTSHDVVLTALFVLAPLVLALFSRPREVAAVGLLAMGLAVAAGFWDHYFGSVAHLVALVVVGTGSVLAVFASHARAQTEGARTEVEELARRLELGRAQLEGVLAVLAEAVTVNAADGRFVFANRAALELIGVETIRELETTPADELFARFESWHEDGAPVLPDELPGRLLLRGKPATPLLIRRVDRATGEHRWLLLKAARLRRRGDEDLAVNVLEDLTDTKERELRERFLAHASDLLASSSLNFEETLQGVVSLAVPQLADWCAVELAEEPASSRQIAAAHRDPEKLAIVEEIRRRYPPDHNATGGVAAVLRSGRGELYAQISDQMLAGGAQDDEHLRLARLLNIRSAMIVPIRAGDRTLGAMMFVTGDTPRAYGERDLIFAQELATRAGTALENARVHRERTQTAETLRRSLLPTTLPSLQGWSHSTLYRAADQGSRIGGDFFDAFAIEGGFTVLLGDVTGKGVSAASLTALSRHSAKAAALLGLGPARTLAMLNRILLDQPQMSLVTCLCATVTQRDGKTRVTIASGGHPLPLRYRAGEAPLELGRHGMILGWRHDAGWPEVSYELAVGDGMLFCTDGVTDTPGEDERFGDARLRRVVGASKGDPELLVAEIDRALRNFQARPLGDDIAIVAVRFDGAHTAGPVLDAAPSPVAHRADDGCDESQLAPTALGARPPSV